MRQHFRIRLRNELVSPLRQHFAKLNIILDDTVMYHSNGFRLIKMRMCIDIAGHAMSRPTGMSDSADTRHGLSAMGQILKYFKPPYRFGNVDLTIIVDCHTRRIIPAVF